MLRHSQGSLAIIGAIAVAVFLIACVAFYGFGNLSITAAVFLAILPAAFVAFLLYRFFAAESESADPATSLAKASPEAAPDRTPAAASETNSEPEPAPVAAEPGGKPVGVDAPRGGQADDLKQIKGVGPKLEKTLNSMGFWHFDQIANWSASDVAWVDENLEGFKGRVTRDKWVSQSQTLAGGGDTAFSKRVEDGDVY